LELEEKAMATDDKIQVSRNEGSVLGTRRLWSRGFQVSKISGPWFWTWKKREERKRRRAWQGERRESPSVRLIMCSSQTFADCDQGSRCGGPGEVPWPFIHPVWMCDAIWGQTVRSTSQTGVHMSWRAGQTGLGSAHKTCRGALGLQYVANVAGVA
jgi:hypothetical protein